MEFKFFQLLEIKKSKKKFWKRQQVFVGKRRNGVGNVCVCDKIPLVPLALITLLIERSKWENFSKTMHIKEFVLEEITYNTTFVPRILPFD